MSAAWRAGEDPRAYRGEHGNEDRDPAPTGSRKKIVATTNRDRGRAQTWLGNQTSGKFGRESSATRASRKRDEDRAALETAIQTRETALENSEHALNDNRQKVRELRGRISALEKSSKADVKALASERKAIAKMKKRLRKR